MYLEKYNQKGGETRGLECDKIEKITGYWVTIDL